MMSHEPSLLITQNVMGNPSKTFGSRASQLSGSRLLGLYLYCLLLTALAAALAAIVATVPHWLPGLIR